MSGQQKNVVILQVPATGIDLCSLAVGGAPLISV